MDSTEILGMVRGLRWSQLKVRSDDEDELIKWVVGKS
jgi:hypothetical protein